MYEKLPNNLLFIWYALVLLLIGLLLSDSKVTVIATITLANISVISLNVWWFLTDQIVYQGNANITRTCFHHYSRTNRAVFVTPYKSIPGSEILVASVPTSMFMKLTHGLNERRVTVKRRLFQKPRVTEISSNPEGPLQ